MILCMCKFYFKVPFYTKSSIMFLQIFFFIFFLILSLLAFYSDIIFNKQRTFELNESSVWCENEFNDKKSCRFKNVCYDPDHRSFLLFLNHKSVIRGIHHYHELQKIQLSSISHHNKFFANISIVPPSVQYIKKKIKIFEKGILMSRFKPDNIMHCIHDDLFPLFLTLETYCMGNENCLKDYVILLHDNHPKGKYLELYKDFSRHEILFLTHEFDYALCFQELITGLSEESLFFQYGFDKPHGPVNATEITQNDVLRFTSFILKNIEDDFEKTDIIFFSRKKTRKILNENYVISAIQNFYKNNLLKSNSSFIITDLNSNSIKFLIQKISKADLLVGMHGAEMILGMFMKPNSIMIELFPFGIRDNISFLKSLTNVEGNKLNYISWRNFKRNNSVPHPDVHPMLGGIKHLPEETQSKIKLMKEVPPVQCCDDPAYLYYMFQDTYVGNDFEMVLKNFSYDHKFENDNFVQKWFFPSFVSNLTCEFDSYNKMLLISWSHPFNVENLNQIVYSTFIAGENMIVKKEMKTKETVLKVKVESDEKKFKLWILAIFLENESKSIDQMYECG